MKKIKVTVPWDQGLHARPATKLVQLSRKYRSSIQLKTHEKVADAKSILSVLLLCATFGTLLEIEAVGEDEYLATSEIERLFNLEEDMKDTAEDITVRDPEERSWQFLPE